MGTFSVPKHYVDFDTQVFDFDTQVFDFDTQVFDFDTQVIQAQFCVWTIFYPSSILVYHFCLHVVHFCSVLSVCSFAHLLCVHIFLKDYFDIPFFFIPSYPPYASPSLHRNTSPK